MVAWSNTEPRLHRREDAHGQADQHREEDGAERQLDVAGNSVKNSSSTGAW
jgi:hypothetical protein